MNLYQFTVDRRVSGDKLNVYLTGTTTAATFYTDAAGTTTGTSPLIADAAGQFPPIYLDTAITYRIKVTNSAGSTTYSDIDPVRLTDEGTADGVLTVRSVDDAKKRTIPANVSAVYCAGYANKGDRGQALYARVATLPSHAGKFTSADGAFWELSENLLNPFMFGAKGDDNGTTGTNDSPAINAMFAFMVAKNKGYPVNFMGGHYFVHDAITLPKIAPFAHLDINGGGAVLRTDQAITILGNAVPTSQTGSPTAADVMAGQCSYDIHNLVFQGNQAAGQVGLHVLATYALSVHNCHFLTLDYGSIGTFCLASAWRDNLYTYCKTRGATLQTAIDLLTGTPLWTGASLSGTPCNVSVLENCRVYGDANQISAFGIFGSDAVRMNGCISEGNGANWDVHFDYQGSTTVKNFSVHMLHCEAPSKVHFKVRAAGKVFIDNLIRSLPTAIYDAQGSVNCEVNIKGISWLGNMPTATGTGSNPNGRWFYHSDGGGYGGTEAGRSGGTGFRFDECVESAYVQLTDPAHWENAALPWMLHVRGILAANGGVQEWSNAAITFATPITLPDGNNLAGFLNGNVTATTTSVPANSTVTEAFTITGLLYSRHHVNANPYNGAFAPPAGIVWNSYVYTNGVMHIRFTNVTGSAISMTSGAAWAYTAFRPQ